ncbi:hypothetical protein EYF80_058081 [Liparis tanakae]|uniref:Uncharacterized protein n=1 Tax=Liparis tanakae TaxID=230148 RepID=A0A4Z2ET59_9TELE|nr:hypothetical protein EYF80_058081 [Liparis tanakae]
MRMRMRMKMRMRMRMKMKKGALQRIMAVCRSVCEIRLDGEEEQPVDAAGATSAEIRVMERRQQEDQDSGRGGTAHPVMDGYHGNFL